MNVEIDDERQTMIDMSVGLTLLVGTLADVVIKAGVIDRSDFCAELARRRRSFGESNPYSWPFETLETALREKPGHSARESSPSIRLVYTREQ